MREIPAFSPDSIEQAMPFRISESLTAKREAAAHRPEPRRARRDERRNEYPTRRTSWQRIESDVLSVLPSF